MNAVSIYLYVQPRGRWVAGVDASKACQSAGLARCGAGVTAVGLRWRQSASGVGAKARGGSFATFLSNSLFPFLSVEMTDRTLGEDGTNDGHRA